MVQYTFLSSNLGKGSKTVSPIAAEQRIDIEGEEVGQLMRLGEDSMFDSAH